MRIENAYGVRVFRVFDATNLDPITVMLQDCGSGSGRLMIECYGCAWAAYWGAIGTRNIAEFLLCCSPQYIAERMHPNDRRMTNREKQYLLRIVEAVHSAIGSLRNTPEQAS